MEENGYERAIVVSDPLHMRRAMLLAEDAGIEAFSSPTPTTMYRSLKTKIPFFVSRAVLLCGVSMVSDLPLDKGSGRMSFCPMKNRTKRRGESIL